MLRAGGHEQRSWIYAVGRHRSPQGAVRRTRHRQPVRLALPLIGAVAWGIDRIFFHRDLFGGHSFRTSDLVSLALAGVGVGLSLSAAALVVKRAQRRHDGLPGAT